MIDFKSQRVEKDIILTCVRWYLAYPLSYRNLKAMMKVTIDKSGTNTAAMAALQAQTGATIEIRQNKCLNNLVEQDHRAVKRIARPMLGFKSASST